MANPLQQILATFIRGGSAPMMPNVTAGGALDVNDQPLPGLLGRAMPAERVSAASGMSAPPMAPSPSPGGSGGVSDMLNSILRPKAAGRNKTVQWLQTQGLDEGTATLMAADKALLRNFLVQRAQGADPMDALKQEKLGLEIEQMRNPTTDDIKEYNFAKRQGYGGTFRDFMIENKKAGATNISNVLNNEGDLFAGMPKDIREQMFERRTEAQDASELIKITNEGRKILDSGAITGAGSGIRISATKWAETLGFPIDPSEANNAEAFKAVMGQAVGKIIKQFGAGTGLSDADRQYAEKIVGGNIELNEAAIRRIFDIAEKTARGKISKYNTMRDAVLSGDLGSMLNVDEPSVYTPPAPGADPEIQRYEQKKRLRFNPATGELE